MDRKTLIFGFACALVSAAVHGLVFASPFPAADACEPPNTRVWTRDENGTSNVRCESPDGAVVAKATAAEPFTVIVTYGRALPRTYSECVVVPTDVQRQVKYRCAALVTQ